MMRYHTLFGAVECSAEVIRCSHLRLPRPVLRICWIPTFFIHSLHATRTLHYISKLFIVA